MDAGAVFKVAIDGPSGVGKSTVSRLLAEKLGALYVDTGAMYRAVALGADRAGIKADDEESLRDFLSKMKLDLFGQRVVLNDLDLTGKIREAPVSVLASIYSSIPIVRSRLVYIQRELAGSVKRVVMEGRDIGTVVLPGAEIKFFLIANEEVRAARRLRDEKSSDDRNIEDVAKDINARDLRDSTRKDSPLSIAEDAITIDTGTLSIEGVVSKMMELIEERV